MQRRPSCLVVTWSKFVRCRTSSRPRLTRELLNFDLRPVCICALSVAQCCTGLNTSLRRLPAVLIKLAAISLIHVYFSVIFVLIYFLVLVLVFKLFFPFSFVLVFPYICFIFRSSFQSFFSFSVGFSFRYFFLSVSF
jgi:hypothetical protein